MGALAAAVGVIPLGLPSEQLIALDPASGIGKAALRLVPATSDETASAVATYAASLAGKLVGKTDPATWFNRPFALRATDAQNYDVYLYHESEIVLASSGTYPGGGPVMYYWNQSVANTQVPGAIAYLMSNTVGGYGPWSGPEPTGAQLAAGHYWINGIGGQVPFAEPFVELRDYNSGNPQTPFATSATMLGWPLNMVWTGSDVLGQQVPSWACHLGGFAGNDNTQPVRFTDQIVYNGSGIGGVYSTTLPTAIQEVLAAWGINTLPTSGMETFPFCGMPGFIPLPQLRLTGMHDKLRAFSVRNGVATNLSFDITSGEVGAYLTAAQTFQGSAAQANAQLQQLIASLNNMDGGKQDIRMLWASTPMGPYDIYQSQQIQTAFANGAAQSDIDSYVVSGKTCATWRQQGNAKPATNYLAYMSSSSLDIVNIGVLITPGSVAGSDVVKLTPTPTLTPDLVIIATADPSSSTATAMTADELVAAVTNALGAANVSANNVSIIAATDYSQWLKGNGGANLAFPADMPFTWWQSLGLSGWSNIVKQMVLGALVPTA